MPSERKSTISAADVKSVAASWVQQHLEFEDYSRRCTASVILSVLFFAASRMRSIYDACQRL